MLKGVSKRKEKRNRERAQKIVMKRGLGDILNSDNLSFFSSLFSFCCTLSTYTVALTNGATSTATNTVRSNRT
jgi:hypothetical protein